MAPRVILLNGPAGVGKTTVGPLLAGLAPNGACIHGDFFREFVISRVEGTVAGGLGYRNGATVAANFIEAGYDLVVFEFVFEAPRHIDRFRAAFRPDVPVHLFTLWAPLATILARERERPGREPLGTRVVACYESIAEHLDELGVRIETGDSAPEAIARTIFRLSEAGAGLLARGGTE